MEVLLLWVKLQRQSAKKNSKGKREPKPYSLLVILRINVMYLLHNLSYPAMEDALFEIESMRRFASLRLSENLPDETTILNLRHLLEQRKFGQCPFDTSQSHLASQGMKLKGRNIARATIIAAPPSTNGRKGERAPRCTR